MSSEGLNILAEMPDFFTSTLTNPNRPDVEGNSGSIDAAFEEARRRPFVLVAQGGKKSIYAIPESFGRHVVKIGPFLDIHREMKVIQELTRAYRELRSCPNAATARRPTLRGFTLPTIPKITKGKTPSGLQRYCQRSDSRGRETWDLLKDRIPEKDNEDERGESKATHGQAAVVLRCIGGLPDSHHTYILNHLYQHESLEKVLQSRENDNLLVRVYLGANSPWYTLPEDGGDQELDADEEDLHDKAMPLLNFPGHVDLLSQYCSSTPRHLRSLAEQMGHGYAIMHWGARFDGRGVEFLLGLNASSAIKLHMLDFEECQPFVCWTKECVGRQLVPAVVENGPYLPRPSVSPDLWRVFRKAYLRASTVTLKANAGLDVWAPEERGEWGSRGGSIFDDWNEADEAADLLSGCSCHFFPPVFLAHSDIGTYSLRGCELEGDGDDGYYEDADERIHKLPRFFIRELKMAFIEQDADENASVVSSTIVNADSRDDEVDSEAGHDRVMLSLPKSAHQIKRPEKSILKRSSRGNDLSGRSCLAEHEKKNDKHKRRKEVSFEEPLPKRNQPAYTASENPIILG